MFSECFWSLEKTLKEHSIWSQTRERYFWMFSESSETISNILDINELKQFRKKKWTMHKSFFENIIKDQNNILLCYWWNSLFITLRKPCQNVKDLYLCQEYCSIF